MELIRIDHSLEELKSNIDTFATYFEGVRDFINDASTAPPSVLDINTGLNSFESISAANASSPFTANLIGGYMVDLAHHISSMAKEISIRNRPKSLIYAEASLDIDNELNYLDATYSEFQAGIKGNINGN